MKFLSEEDHRIKISQEFNRKLKDKEEKRQNEAAKLIKSPKYSAIEPSVPHYSFGLSKREIESSDKSDPPLRYPRINFVKPGKIRYSFEKAERFPSNEKDKPKSELFKNQKYALDEHSSFLKSEPL